MEFGHINDTTIKLAHTLKTDCFLIRNNQFCFCLKESRKLNVCLWVWLLMARPVQQFQSISASAHHSEHL